MANRLRRDTDNSSHHVSAVDVAGFTITNLDFRICIVSDDYTPAADANLVGKSNSNLADSEWKIELVTSGRLRLAWYDGSLQHLFSSAGTDITGLVAGGEPIWIRATLDVDNGANQHVASIYNSLENPDTDPDLLTWNLLDSVTRTGVTSIVAGSNPIKLGWSDRFGFGNYLGSYYYFELRDDIDGSVVADPDFRDTDQGDWEAAIGGGSVTDNHVNDWTVGGAGWTHIVGEPEFPAEQGIESDNAADAVLQPEPLFAVEQASEAETASDAVLTAEPVVNAVLAVEVEVAFEAVFGPEPVFAAELAAEVEQAFAALLSAGEPPFNPILVTGSFDRQVVTGSFDRQVVDATFP